ncbi:hypothetical protein ACFL1B_00555 [Nanoarchaeota archaeon]
MTGCIYKERCSPYLGEQPLVDGLIEGFPKACDVVSNREDPVCEMYKYISTMLDPRLKKSDMSNADQEDLVKKNNDKNFG